MTHSLLLRAISRHLFLPTWMVALALLARGHDGTGDGFSAALLVVLGVLLQYLAFGRSQIEQPQPRPPDPIGPNGTPEPSGPTGPSSPSNPIGAKPAGALVPLRWLPRFVGIGLLALLIAVLAPMLAGALPLTHFPRPAQAVPYLGSFALHTGFLVDVGVFLVVLGFGLSIMSRVSRHVDAGSDTGPDTSQKTRSHP